MTIDARWWRRARLLGGALVLAALVVRVGTGPFLEGLRRADPVTLACAVALTLLTTLCCVWRWRAVARRLGVDVPVRDGLAAYYRSQLLNATLPGGVVGDVHRGLRHGHDVGDRRRGLASVAVERAAGQGVQVLVAVAVLGVLPSALLVLLLGLVLVGGLRAGWRTAGPVLLASALSVAGHVAVFLLAARAAGVTAPLTTLLPLAMLVLLAASVPINVAGWGPREGMAAWAFGAAGLGAAAGVTTAVVFGVMAFVATLPGLLSLLAAPARPVVEVGSRA